MTISGRKPGWLTKEEVLAQALEADPKWSPWPYELLHAALDSMEERGDNISSTALVGACPRSTVLERREPYIASLDQLYRAFRGTWIHAVLEKSQAPGSATEVRFIAPLDDDEFSCKPDVVRANGVMLDWKNVERIPAYDYPYRHHTLQLQFNRWCVNHAQRWEKDAGNAADKQQLSPLSLLEWQPKTMVFKHLEIVYLDINQPKTIETQETVQVPLVTDPTRTKPTRVPGIWSDDRVLGGAKTRDGWEYGLVDRFNAMRAALDSYPDFPEGVEEIWGGEATWDCPGFPHCPFPNCLAKRRNSLTW